MMISYQSWLIEPNSILTVKQSQIKGGDGKSGIIGRKKELKEE
jgi:hypothetical protein